MDNNEFKVRIQTKYDSRKRNQLRIRNAGLCFILLIAIILLLDQVVFPGCLDHFAEAKSIISITPEPTATKQPIIVEKKLTTIPDVTPEPTVEPVTASAIELVPPYGEEETKELEKSNELKPIAPVVKYLHDKKNSEWRRWRKKVHKSYVHKKKVEERKRRRKLARIRKEKIKRLRRRNAKSVPTGFGKTLAYMKWDCVTARGTKQWKLKCSAEHYNSKGMGMVNDRFAIAIKPYYGAVGDYLDITFEDGTIMKAIVVDEKGGENEPGKGNYSSIHASSNRKQLALGVTNKVHTDGSVLEFVVDGEGKTTGWNGFAGYNGSKTVNKLYPQFAQNIKYISKMGNYWN